MLLTDRTEITTVCRNCQIWIRFEHSEMKDDLSHASCLVFQVRYIFNDDWVKTHPKEIFVTFKKTLNDLPVPAGSWQESYEARNRKWNIMLAASVTLFASVMALVSIKRFQSRTTLTSTQHDAYNGGRFSVVHCQLESFGDLCWAPSVAITRSR